MRSAAFTIALVVCIATSVSAACGSESGSVKPAPATSSGLSSIDRIVQQSYPHNFGVELAIYRNGVLKYARGYGLRDRGRPEQFYGTNFWGITQPDQLLKLPRGRFAPDEATDFDLGSVSKEFTAGAILLLQQDGKLSVNDPLSKYFPTLPQSTNMPLIYLLQHRSGFVDYNTFGVYPDFSGAYAQFMASGQTDYQPIVDRLAQFPLLFPPGSQYSYSNTNYVLLGMIVARVSGMPVGQFLQQRVFGPLNMTRTEQGYPAPPVTDLALGYELDGTTIFRSWQWNLQWLAGPGGLTSTVQDIEKWDECVRSPAIFTRSSLRQMFKPSPYPQPFGTYAMGWVISKLDGHKYVWHDGAVGGFTTMNATFPNDGLDIIILTNAGSGPDPYNIVPSILPLALAL